MSVLFCTLSAMGKKIVRSRSVGRPPKGCRAMTNAERQKKYRETLKRKKKQLKLL